VPEGESVEGAASGLLSLVTPCPQRLDPALPASPVDAAPVGVALSGGGFRATLAGLGVVQMLEDVGLLPRLRFVSSVSGGSVAAASLATQWPAIRAGASLRERVVEPIVTAVSSKSLKWGEHRFRLPVRGCVHPVRSRRPRRCPAGERAQAHSGR
jgi:NTE family protein